MTIEEKYKIYNTRRGAGLYALGYRLNDAGYWYVFLDEGDCSPYWVAATNIRSQFCYGRNTDNLFNLIAFNFNKCLKGFSEAAVEKDVKLNTIKDWLDQYAK